MDELPEIKEIWGWVLDQMENMELYELGEELHMRIDGYRDIRAVPRPMFEKKVLNKVTKINAGSKKINHKQNEEYFHEDQLCDREKIEKDIALKKGIIYKILQDLLLTDKEENKKFAQMLFQKYHSNSEMHDVENDDNHTEEIHNNYIDLEKKYNVLLERLEEQETQKVKELKRETKLKNEQEVLKKTIKNMEKNLTNEKEKNNKNKKEFNILNEKMMELQSKIEKLCEENLCLGKKLEIKINENEKLQTGIDAIKIEFIEYKNNIQIENEKKIYTDIALWVTEENSYIKENIIQKIYIDFKEDEAHVFEKLQGIRELWYVSSEIKGYLPGKMKNFLKKNKFGIKIKAFENIGELNTILKREQI